jgi:hypothetical protein
MPAEALLIGLVPVVVELLPELIGAIRVGDHERARQLAEEAAQRQAFEALQRSKRRQVKSPNPHQY